MKMFICGIIFEVKPSNTSVIKRTPKIGNAMSKST